jgi:hypothetical protein
VLSSEGHADFDSIQIFHVAVGDFLYDFGEKGAVPLVLKQRLLKYFMEESSIDERR